MEKRTNRFIKVNGNKWGLASNAIHMLDLFLFLFGDQDISADKSKFHSKIYRTKRKGFVEFGGTVTFKNKIGDSIILTDNRQNNGSTQMEFGYIKRKVLSIENSSKRFSLFNKKQEIIKNGDFIMPLQSEMARPVVEEILTCGTCGLTTLNESMKLHIPMLEMFIDHINKHSETGIKQEFCPIT